MKHILWSVLTSIALMFSLSAQAAPLLVNPDPIAVPAGITEVQITSDIKRALVSRGWVVSGESKGKIDATLNIRSHSARIAIYHDLKQVRIEYVSSENLKYKEKDGKRYIHRNYLSWVNNVAGDISKNMQLSALN
ncbi:hypothetical protein [Cellvibrio sp. UBA7661]|uniref:hypothetical protein n=1 Tax=Cellvibrio sp. UBA7661 TaxID=1946311 RepID=UPI002F36126A